MIKAYKGRLVSLLQMRQPATALYGTAFGQYLFYLRSFPHDSRKLKLFITMAFCLETIHEYSLSGIYWSILISCRRSMSLECTSQLLWWQVLLAVLTAYCIIFAVQCFYVCRVWIITAQNRWITGIICGLATVSFVCGMILSGLIFNTRKPDDLFYTKWSQLAAFTSALCDAVTTGTVWWFLRPARTDNIRSRSRSYLNELLRVFIQMGLFSFLVATTLAVLYQFQEGLIGRFYSAAPGAVIGNSYMNSMLAVLNARKSVREREQLSRNNSELPTIPTIH
ncbi:uncharacterized protein EDB93DRAFT_272787 [Suillus bovinus]|uniref:uncharacterized protein n=1 Tax=Suillus bovinus TaxID=48563 RepID=UPI001B85B46F|nr:uncharacterized protein EDB93DRAFT_272787 [Suillus bovinus]KAG2159220.1 hypothetical protein EDB93DRAFT_272787 [Suillus bovinus]